MISYRFTSRVPNRWLGVLAVLVLAACPHPRGGEVLKKTPAEIMLPPKGSASASDDIERALDRFDKGPAHNAPCQGCTRSDDVTIKYVGLTKDIKAGSGPANFRIVAIIQNYSNQDVLHTPSNTTFKAKTKYLMWVHSQKKKAVWGFIELGAGYDPNIKPIGLLEECTYKTSSSPSPTDDADFKNCGDDHAPRTSSRLIASAYAATPSANGGTSMLASIALRTWVACDPDCCTGTTKLEF